MALFEMTSLSRVLQTVSFIVSLVAVIPSAASADALPSTLNSILENTTSIDQVITMWAFGDDSNLGTLRSIRSDLRNQWGTKPFPKIRLRGQELVVNGQPSGFVLMSVNPIMVNYHGRVWRYQKDRDQGWNSDSLLEFARAKPRAASSLFAIPEAHADSRIQREIDVGDGVGAVVLTGVGAVLCGIAEPCPLFIAAIAGATLTTAGLIVRLAIPPSIKVSCQPHATPPYVQVRLPYGKMIQLTAAPGKEPPYVASLPRGNKSASPRATALAVAKDPKGYASLAKLIGHDSSECPVFEKQVNDKLRLAYDAGIELTPLQGGVPVQQESPASH
jgi:hypothetical protein